VFTREGDRLVDPRDLRVRLQGPPAGTIVAIFRSTPAYTRQAGQLGRPHLISGGNHVTYISASLGTSRPLPAPSPEVIYRPVKDGAVLLSTNEEVYFGLNDAGACIWELLAKHETLEELTAALEGIYPEVEPDRLRDDATDLLDDLLAHGLVQARS
jgi:hypothetical protein